MMTQAELTQKISIVRKRHNFRQSIVVLLSLSIFFGGLFSTYNFELSDSGRHLYIYFVIALFIVVVTAGTVKNYLEDKKDCYKNSIVCPHCGKHLYDWHRIVWGGESPEKTGKCGHCKMNLIQKDAANGPIDFEDQTPEERKKLMAKLRLFLLFNYILWPSLTWLSYNNVQSTPIIERQKIFTWVVILISIIVSAAAYVAVEIKSRKCEK
jgi:hypothetical protein